MNDHSEDSIHTDFLLSHGWERKPNSTYTREHRTVKYDGTDWYYDGERIDNSISKNGYLKKPSVNPPLPPPPFKDASDYYSRLMENK